MYKSSWIIAAGLVAAPLASANAFDYEDFSVHGFVSQGYVITSSSGDSAGWVVEFQRDGLQGSVTIIKADANISQYSVVLIGS